MIEVGSLHAKLSVDDYKILMIFFANIFTGLNYTLLINIPRVAQIGPSHK